MTAKQDYKRRRNEELKEEMPRHVMGAMIAVGVGALAVIAGLWATNPGAAAMHADLDAHIEYTGSVAV